MLAAGLIACAVVGAERTIEDSEVLRGRVELIADGSKKSLVLKTADGAVVPLVEDSRGRAFRSDRRLRHIDLELTVRRSPDESAVQVLRVCEITKDGKYELDYWCEICSIQMFELKECECCQGPIELRKRKVEK